MTQSDLPDTDLDAIEPIDADFEPAPSPEEEKAKAAKSGGPGWIGASVLALMAAGAGGIIGLVADKPPFASGQGGAGTAALEKQVASVIAAQSELETQLADNTAEMETRLRTDLSAFVSSDGEGENLAALVAELDAVSKRLDEAMKANPGNETLSELTKRISALESVDTSGETSAQDVARAVAGLGERLTNLETKLAELTEAATGEGSEKFATLESDIRGLKDELAQIANSTSEDSSKMTALLEDMREKEETALKSAAKAKASTDAALALAAIETASARGESFAAEYRNLRAAMPDSDPVRNIATAASSAVPTIDTLRSEFNDLRATALDAAPKAAEPGALGWLNRTFGDAVTVEPANGQASSTESKLDEASAALKTGDLESALATISTLDTAPLQVFADWIESANARITLETNLTALRKVMIEGGE